MIDWASYRVTDRRCSAYIQKPADLDTVDRCQYYDQITARYISDMEQEIERMKEYRAELYQRMRTIYAAPYHLKITLKREKRYQDKVIYYLQYWKEYESGEIPPEQISCDRYPGADRAQALKDYRQALKAHPGVKTELDIQKSAWER